MLSNQKIIEAKKKIYDEHPILLQIFSDEKNPVNYGDLKNAVSIIKSN